MNKNFILLTLCFPLVLLAEPEPQKERKIENEPYWFLLKKHAQYVVPPTLHNDIFTKSQKPYDDFVDSLLPGKTVQEYCKAGYKQMHHDVIEETLRPLNLSDLDNKIKQFYSLKKQVKKKDQRSGLKISYDADIPNPIRERIEDICKSYNIRSRFAVKTIKESDKNDDTLGSVKTNAEFRPDFKWVTIKNRKVKIKETLFSSEKVNRTLIHEIAGHLKNYDALDKNCLELLFPEKYSPEKLKILHEWQADLKPAIKNLAIARQLETDWKKLKDTERGSIYAPGGAIYDFTKITRKLLEAQSRWIWGQKGYEKYGDQYYDNAFVNHHNNLTKNSNKRFWEFWK